MKIRTSFLIIMMAISARAAGQQAGKSVDVNILVDSLNNALFKNYIFPDKSKLISDYINLRLKQGSYKFITDPKILASQLEDDIQSVHHDGHLRIHYDPNFPKDPPRQMPSQQGIDSAALRRQRLENFGFKKVEILSGNIGYVQFTGFSGMVEYAKPTIASAFRFLSNADAVIIDLRKNGGGSPFMVKHISSYFFSGRTRLNDIYDRRADKTMEFWAEPGDADSMNLSMPLYILTSKHTFSAAEDFTYAMQVNKRAVIVGDTTGGGAHPTGPVYIGQDFVADIPFARSINHITMTDWEGTGVIPDVPSVAEDALIRAQEYILLERIRNAGSNTEKQTTEWLIDALHATDEYPISLTEDLLKNYQGEFGRFKVFLNGRALYLTDFIGRTFRLKPITQNQFLGDDWFQVEFTLVDGIVTKMTMKGRPGWVDVLEKKITSE